MSTSSYMLLHFTHGIVFFPPAIFLFFNGFYTLMIHQSFQFTRFHHVPRLLQNHGATSHHLLLNILAFMMLSPLASPTCPLPSRSTQRARTSSLSNTTYSLHSSPGQMGSCLCSSSAGYFLPNPFYFSTGMTFHFILLIQIFSTS